MSEMPLIRATRVIVGLALLAAASVACGQVYKCTDAAGKTTYSGAPCDETAKPLNLPPDSKGTKANPSMCAQLQDEKRRLEVEAERDANRGRAESKDHAKQRQTITKRYGERCVGISRSGPGPG
jgi:Domain of unknown function (DUF4124)